MIGRSKTPELPTPPDDLWFLSERTRRQRIENESRTHTNYYTSEADVISHLRWLHDSPQTHTVLERRLWRFVEGRWVEYEVFVRETSEPQWIGGPK